MTLAPVGRDAEIPARVDQRALQDANEWPEEDAATAEGDDRVGHELAGAVVGHFPAPLDPDELDAARGQLGRRRPDVRLVGLPAERQDRRMLEE